MAGHSANRRGYSLMPSELQGYLLMSASWLSKRLANSGILIGCGGGYMRYIRAFDLIGIELPGGDGGIHSRHPGQTISLQPPFVRGKNDRGLMCFSAL